MNDNRVQGQLFKVSLSKIFTIFDISLYKLKFVKVQICYHFLTFSHLLYSFRQNFIFKSLFVQIMGHKSKRC